MNTQAHHMPHQAQESSIHLGSVTFRISRRYVGSHSVRDLLQERIMKDIDSTAYIDEPAGPVV